MNPFAIGVRLRNALYDHRILNVRTLSRPVISIGNLSVGGTGKTPFTIALGTLLKARGLQFDVLSRGYGRKSKDVVIVDPEGSPEQFGDEPLLIARKLHVPVIVGADRYEAGVLAEQKFPESLLHLLDDGFQHRRLHRDFDIVLLSEEDLGASLLPLGRLREPLSSLRRADAIAIPTAAAFPLQGAAWRMRRNLLFIVPMSRVVAFCGIAKPHQFFAGLKRLGMDLADTLAFPDHHHYRQHDIEQLLAAQAKTGAKGFITTEKDAINLGPLASQLRTFEAAGLEVELEAAPQAMETLLSTLEQRCGCRF